MTTDKAREILGVKEGASSSEIEQAWSNWISIRHRVQDKELVKQRNEAYETLKGKSEPTPQQASSKDSSSMHFQENLIKDVPPPDPTSPEWYTAENDYLIYAYIELDHPHRCYVGQTLQSRASQRDRDHRKGKSGSPYFNAFVLHEIIYGKKHFDDVLRYEVLEKFRGTANKCAEKEDEHIQRKNSIENSWNLLKSGVSNKHTETQKENNKKNNPAKAINQGARRVKTKGVLTESFVQSAINYGLDNGIIEKDKEYNLQELIVLIAMAHLASFNSALNINEKPSVDEIKSVTNNLNTDKRNAYWDWERQLETSFHRPISVVRSIANIETAIEREQDWNALVEWFESDTNYLTEHLAFQGSWIAHSDQKEKSILDNIKSACLKKYQAKKKEIEERERAREEEKKRREEEEKRKKGLEAAVGCFVGVSIIVLIISLIASASGC